MPVAGRGGTPNLLSRSGPRGTRNPRVSERTERTVSLCAVCVLRVQPSVLTEHTVLRDVVCALCVQDFAGHGGCGGRSRSQAAANARTGTSAKRRPTSWIPIGRPSALVVHGTLMAGWPEMLNVTV